MSVCCMCIKTTADSKILLNKNEFFLDISDSFIEYDIFDTDHSVIDSNEYIESDIDITSQLNNITMDEKNVE